MEFSIATLLANFTDDKLVARKVLEKKLGCEDELSLQKLHIALEVLEKIGILVKERGKYRRVQEQDLIEAKLRCSSKGFCFAIQEEEGSEDIYIRESYLSNAWNGDRVLVRVLKEGSRRRSPEGEVRLILERANQSLLARIKQATDGFRAVPLDDRLLFELYLQKNGNNLASAIDHLVHVQVTRYPLAQDPPLGRVVQILGSDAEAAADIDLVTCKHDLARTFSDAAIAAASSLPNKVSKIELKKRLDLRQLFTLTLTRNLPDSNLVENAFSLTTASDGKWQIGVHIADVAHYVQPEEILDREGLKRGRTVYLGETVLPMLPEAVQQRCTLVPGSDRLAISVLITIDPVSGEIDEFEIQPTVIKVDTSLSTQAAEDLISLADTAQSDPQIDLLSKLSTLSQVVKQQRLSRGSFEINLPSSLNPYDDEGMLGIVSATDSKVRTLMLELLLLTNQLVATQLQTLGVPAIYRQQTPPDAEDAQEMIKLASNLGVEIALEKEESVQPEDYQRFTKAFASSESEQVLTYLLQDTLKPGFYSTTAAAHFGLALTEGYTHAHAPLRRYPDLLIQRVLHTVFEHGRDRRTTRAKERVNLRHSSSYGDINWNVLPPEMHQELESDLARIIIQVNDREKEVQEAEADLIGLQKAQLMKQRIGEVFDGVITGVQSYGFFVEIEVPAIEVSTPQTPIRVEGLVHVSSLKDDWYEYRARQQALFGRKNRASYRLGDRVAVQVKSVDYYRQQIDLVTVGGDRQPNGEALDANENHEMPNGNLAAYDADED